MNADQSAGDQAEHERYVTEVLRQQPTTSLYLGQLHPKATKALIYEIGCQAGPVTNVNYQEGRAFAFIEYPTVVRRVKGITESDFIAILYTGCID